MTDHEEGREPETLPEEAAKAPAPRAPTPRPRDAGRGDRAAMADNDDEQLPVRAERAERERASAEGRPWRGMRDSA